MALLYPNLLLSHTTAVTSCRAQGKPDFLFLIRDKKKKPLNLFFSQNCWQAITELVIKSLCYDGVSLLALFLSMFFPFSPFFFFFSPFVFLRPLFPPALFFRGLCRGFHLSGLKLLLNFTLCSVLKCADFSVCLIDGSSERGEKDASKITTYPPGAVRFDCELRAVQVSCGFHHSGGYFSLLSLLALVILEVV